MDVKKKAGRVLKNISQKEYEKRIKKARMSFYDVFQFQQDQQKRFLKQPEPGENKITDEIIIFQCQEGRLDPNAFKLFSKVFRMFPETDLIYCDEAFKNARDVFPDFRPDWSPDTFLYRYNLGSVVAVRKKRVDEISSPELNQKISGFAEITDVCSLSQDEQYDVCRKIIKIKSGIKNVVHLPWILFWREKEMVCPRFSAEESGKTVGKNSVSVIIPSKDHPELLEKCLNSLLQTTEELTLEICVVDNGSSVENQKKVRDLSEKYQFHYICEKFPFNFSKMCNTGVEHTKGKQVLFLNDDIECVSNGWLSEMVSLAERSHVGAVGSKLLYPDRIRIQHAGIVNLPMGPVHKLQFLNDEETYYDYYNRGVRNVIAVTGACLLVRRELYLAAGGMNENLSVAFNDVEFCFRLHEMGYFNAVVQDFPLIHHESLSRGEDESAEKWKRLMSELNVLYRLHPLLKGKDPFYSRELNAFGLNTAIYPKYFDGRHEIQSVSPSLCGTSFLKDAKEEKCLLFRIEQFKDSGTRIELNGYGVVLGSDNACFHRYLILRRTDLKEHPVYRMKLKGQYRHDLEENMPDQVNTGLSGFWISLEKGKLKKGKYQIGLMAEKSFGRSSLYVWAERRFEIL